MNPSKFRQAWEEHANHPKPYTNEQRDDLLRVEKAMEKSAKPEHSYKVGGEFMTDWVVCACGWTSPHFWDGVDLAIDTWQEHVANELGLLSRKCPCGKKYVPADGGRPCHTLEPTHE